MCRLRRGSGNRRGATRESAILPPLGTHRARAECRPLNRRHTAPSRSLLLPLPPAPSSCRLQPNRVELRPRSMCHTPRLRTSCPNVRRDARTVTNLARPELARALPRRRSGLARLRSPLWLRSLPAGLLANARPPLPATAAGQLPRLASRVAALRASASFSPNHPARASCCDALCRLARSLNVALRAQSPRPASQGSPAPRPATANAFASLSPRAKPSRSNLPAARAASSRVCRHRATPTVSPAARLRRGKARDARRALRARALSGTPSRSPASGGNILR